MKRLMPKLVRSYAIDSLARSQEGAQQASMDQVRRFLTDVGRADVRSHRAVGHGRDIRLVSDHVTGGGLSCDGVIIQLSAFRRRREPKVRDLASTLPKVERVARGASPFPKWEDVS